MSRCVRLREKYIYIRLMPIARAGNVYKEDAARGGPLISLFPRDICVYRYEREREREREREKSGAKVGGGAGMRGRRERERELTMLYVNFFIADDEVNCV